MPTDNGSGCHLDERFLPSSPALSQYDPEQLVCRSESPARALGVKSEQLLTQGKIFEDDILAGPECTNNPAEEVPEPYDHAQNLTGTLPIELGAKSLILRVYAVLMNDRFESSEDLRPMQIPAWTRWHCRRRCRSIACRNAVRILPSAAHTRAAGRRLFPSRPR